MRVVRELSQSQWIGFIENHSDSQVFHTPEMFEVFERARGHQPQLWATIDDDGEVHALMLPVRLTMFNGPLSRFTSRDVAYGGVLCSPGPQGTAALGMLLEDYKNSADSSVLFSELRHLGDTSAFQPVFCRSGFIYEEHLNYLIDLQRPPETVFQDIGPRTRKQIRRGLRNDEIVVQEIESRSQIGAIYEVLLQTYANARVPLADLSLFLAAYDVLKPKDMIRITMTKVQGFVAAVSIDLLYHGVMYGWYGGTVREYGHHQPNEILTWRLLEWGAQNGYRVYDFGGAGKPDEDYGVRDFKAKFGGRLVSYGRNICIHSPALLQISKAGYSLFRQLYSKRVLSPVGSNHPTGIIPADRSATSQVADHSVLREP